MTAPIQLSIIFGTRPELIKLAPVILLGQQDPRFQIEVIFTGQHVELVRDAIDFFKIKIDQHLKIMHPGQSLNQLLIHALTQLEHTFNNGHPRDAIMVQGDTTTVLAGALVAFHMKLPIAHVEAGLRSYDLLHPYPEEGNRQLVSRLARWHFAPTKLSANNLLNEKIQPEDIFITGNTVVDAVYLAKEFIQASNLQPTQRLSALGIALNADEKLILITAHRRENFGEGILNICGAVKQLCERYPNLHFAWPVHLNPAVHDVVSDAFKDMPQVHLLQPLDYPNLLALLQHAHLIMTDSGGIQEESPSYQKPVLILRTTTERPEVLDVGAGVLVGTDTDLIVSEATRLLEDTAYYAKRAYVKNPFGDGTAAQQILDRLALDLHHS